MLRSAAVLLLLFSSIAFAADAPPGPPANLVDLVKDPATPPVVQQVEDSYLARQWERVTGAQASAGGKRKTAAAKLSDDEKAKLTAWFDGNPKFRRRFLLALDPREDDYAAAARVALTLKDKYPKECDALERLVIAFAMTWDEEESLKKIHVHGIPEIWNGGYKYAAMVDSFGWYVKNQARMAPWFKNTPWQLLKYVACDMTDVTERDWLATIYPTFRNNLGIVYSEIVYDHSKLRDNIGKLDGKPHTLPNLKQFGGVCRDQAYYARAACRSMGMPAYFADGAANSGGLHAWVGWIVFDQNTFKLTSHGRYAYDKYFTAEISDPQSNERIFDYLVGIEAKALSDEKGYELAELFYRTWQEVESDPAVPAAAKCNLLVGALQKNAYHRAAWLAIADATTRGELPPESAAKQWDFLLKTFREFPDFIYSMAAKFSTMHKTAQAKYTFFEANSKLFLGLQRQDLVARIRIDEIDMCEREDRKDLAAQVAITGMQECSGEGERGALLADRAVKLLRQQKQAQTAIKPLNAALKGMMKVRAGHINPNWVKMMGLLRELYEETGDKKLADATQQEIDRTLRTSANNAR